MSETLMAPDVPKTPLPARTRIMALAAGLLTMGCYVGVDEFQANPDGPFEHFTTGEDGATSDGKVDNDTDGVAEGGGDDGGKTRLDVGSMGEVKEPEPIFFSVPLTSDACVNQNPNIDNSDQADTQFCYVANQTFFMAGWQPNSAQRYAGRVNFDDPTLQAHGGEYVLSCSLSVNHGQFQWLHTLDSLFGVYLMDEPVFDPYDVRFDELTHDPQVLGVSDPINPIDPESGYKRDFKISLPVDVCEIVLNEGEDIGLVLRQLQEGNTDVELLTVMSTSNGPQGAELLFETTTAPSG